jgi:dihydropteroate synthase
VDGRALALRVHGEPQARHLMRQVARARRDALLRTLKTRPVVMGVLNVTPDSFSDGGRFFNFNAAVAHAKLMASEGCDIIDVGGESTRPGATPVAAAAELGRIEAVVATLAGMLEVPISVDTYKAPVARRAIELGAVLVNDVGGLQQDAAMADVVTEAQALIIIMHSRQAKQEDIDIINDIRVFFERSLAIADSVGIPREHIILDPGIGFGKTSRQNRDVIARLGELKGYGLPLLVGASRKRFLGSLSDGTEATLIGTLAANLAAAAAGASLFRVHDVAEHVTALKVFRRIQHGCD